jgi:hypothetical protein
MAANTESMRKEVNATLNRLEKKDPGLKQLLQDAYGYAVFPSVGKAAVVIGGAYGKGMVFEKGKPIGYATLGQTTIGVQIGGDTFSEVVVFESKETLDRFKKGKFSFAANASAVLVKAGASATANFEKGAAAFAYSSGGMLLEAAIGGQKFKFKPLGEEEQESEGQKSGQRQKESGGGKAKSKSRSGGGNEGEEEQDAGDEGDEQEQGAGGPGLFGKAMDLAKEYPVATALIGVGVVGAAAVIAARAMGVKSPWSASGEQGSDSGESEGDEAYDDEGDEDEDESGSHRNGKVGARRQDDEDEDEGDDEDEDTDARAESDEDDDDAGGEEEEEDEAPRQHRSGGSRRW